MAKQELKVVTFKANQTVREQIASLSKQMNMNRSKVIRLAIGNLHSEATERGDGT